MSPMGPDVFDKLQDLAKLVPEFQPFLSRSCQTEVLVVGFRNDVEHETEALSLAWKRLGAILDGLAFLTEELQPKVSSVVQVREGDSSHAAIKTFSETGWIRWEAPDPNIRKPWEERNVKLFDYVLRFIEVVTLTEKNRETPLTRQLAYSMKMYRHGILSRASGTEYLCKFSALEGIVCGPATRRKVELLKERLDHLFSRPGHSVKREVNRLWEQRCEASHQARAFERKLMADMPLLEQLVLGSFVFAIDHVENVMEVPELWHRAKSYKLPDFVLVQRPKEMVRLGYTDCVVDYNLRWNNVGSLCDAIFASNAERLRRQPD